MILPYLKNILCTCMYPAGYIENWCSDTYTPFIYTRITLCRYVSIHCLCRLWKFWWVTRWCPLHCLADWQAGSPPPRGWKQQFTWQLQITMTHRTFSWLYRFTLFPSNMTLITKRKVGIPTWPEKQAIKRFHLFSWHHPAKLKNENNNKKKTWNS